MTKKETIYLHGVFISVFELGIFIMGESGSGKSETTLALIEKGHVLISDDAPCFKRIADNKITGSCPKSLRDFLYIRDLGPLNIRTMFGDKVITYNYPLSLIIHLSSGYRDTSLDINHPYSLYTILGVKIPSIMIAQVHKRNLAVLIEAAARNYLIKLNSHSASAAFIKQQHKLSKQI